MEYNDDDGGPPPDGKGCGCIAVAFLIPLAALFAAQLDERGELSPLLEDFRSWLLQLFGVFF